MKKYILNLKNYSRLIISFAIIFIVVLFAGCGVMPNEENPGSQISHENLFALSPQPADENMLTPDNPYITAEILMPTPVPEPHRATPVPPIAIEPVPAVTLYEDFLHDLRTNCTNKLLAITHNL